MTSPKRQSGILLIGLLLLAIGATPVGAASSTGYAAAGAVLDLPPLPEWPIIGPILLRLGLVEATAEPAPVPDPNLPEYRISTIGDLDQLDSVQAGDRVRIIASEADANRMVQELLAQQVGEDATLQVSFEPNRATFDATADAALVERAGVDLPALVRGSLKAIVSFNAGGADCRPTVDIQTLKVNGWSIGIRGVAQRMIDERIPELWPSGICIERILFMDGEAAAEGYRAP